MVTIKGHVGVPVSVPYVPGNSSLLAGNGQANGVQGMAVSTPRSRLSRTVCDPFPCKSVPHTPVKIVQPSRSGWSAAPVEQTTTDNNGDFTITVDKSLLTSGGPVFVVALDPTGEYPLMATIPADLVYLGTIELAIDRTTTAAAIMHCPGGMNPPPTGSYCWSDPQESTNTERLEATIDVYFANNPSTALNPEEYLPDVSNDPDVQDDMNQILPESEQPEGFKPITLDNAHNLEGMGRIFTEPEPTTMPQPKPTYPPQTNPPNLPGGFPELPADGIYDISVRQCSQLPGYNQCQDLYSYSSEFDVNGLVDALNTAADACNSQGVSCRVSYSPYNGRSFTASMITTACYGGSCSSVTTHYIITRVG